MGRSQQSFNKKEIQKRKVKKRKEKAEKRQARKESGSTGGLDDMIAYVDEHGNILDTPPDPAEKEEIKAEDIQLGSPNRNDGEEEVEKTGTVAFFNDQKGFGFIKVANSRQELFVHINNCEDQIAEGNKVSFEVDKGPKGYIAVKVKKI